MIYLHPVLGVLASLLLVWIGFRGLAARRRRPDAAAARATHRVQAPRIFALMALAAVGGTGSVALLRDDLDVAGSTHFWLGWGGVTLCALLWLSGGRVHTDARAKGLHPVVGLAAMALAVLTALVGIRMLP